MATLSSVTPYATVDEADAIMGTDTPWATATDDQKSQALVNGKLYMDDTYECAVPDPDNPDESLKEANSLLANESLSSDLFAQQTGQANLTENTSEAGSVRSTKKYNASKGTSWVDPYPGVTALVGDVCYLTKGSLVTKVNLRR